MFRQLMQDLPLSSYLAAARQCYLRILSEQQYYRLDAENESDLVKRHVAKAHQHISSERQTSHS